nr:MAG TPA: hypothetical protein [Caudoviricetes sp.]
MGSRPGGQAWGMCHPIKRACRDAEPKHHEAEQKMRKKGV